MNVFCGLTASLLFSATALAAAAGAGRLDLSVPLPPGETALTDLGLYRVGWQSYGRDPVWMPTAWVGHFDAATGISCTPWGRVLGRDALLLHSPWHVPAGKTWVDYRLALPQLAPIRLSFGITMGPDVAVPDRSDGVTFSCSLTAGGQERELMRQHHDQARWRDYAFDLSAYAGQTVTLRLQVEPGPKNNASWDYSFFGDARLVAGPPSARAADRLAPLLNTPASRAMAAADRTLLSNSPRNGVAPSNLLPGTNTLEPTGPSWRFTYLAADCRLVYTYTPATGTLDDFTAQVDDGRPFAPAHGGGATASVPSGRAAVQGAARFRELPLQGGRPAEIRRDGDSLRVRWEYDLEGQPLRLDWTFQLLGKALVVSARCETPVVSRFSLGEALAPLRKTIRVPYLSGHLYYLPVQNVFTCRYLDWTVSQSSACPQGTATYEPKTDGARNSLIETGYIAVSPEVGEVLPNIPHPPSPYLAVLGPRVMLDVWGHTAQGYAGDAAKLRELKDNGVDHLVIIQHDWQRYGYDVKLPDHLPANPAYGGDSGMIAYGRAANDCGYLWSLHENYIDLYPDAPSYDPAARVFNADGSPSKAWYNPGTKVQSFGLKCNRALGFARQNSPEAHRRFGTTAAYLDVHTCVPPWHQLDHEAGQPLAAMQKAKVQFDTELFQFERDAHAGPLFGEGANHFYWAGRCDGVEAQVEGGEDHAPFLDFDLLKLHPQMVNHGMGYYERWYRRGYEVRYGVDAGSVEQWDKYRAMELAYGHAGFLGHVLVHNVQAVAREHHLMHPVQRLYGTARPLEILYEVEGRLVPTSAALVAGQTTRQRLRYDSGLTLWVNWRPEPWRLEPRKDTPSRSTLREYILPQWGFLALGPGTEVGTVLRGGHVADYAECPEYLFVDARTGFELPYRRAAKDIEPRLRDYKYLGDDRFQVTYEWIVNDNLEADYNCFVHAANPAAPATDRIVFQGDHALPKPTGQWRKGEVIVDGPHELRVSDKFDRYDLSIGLFKRERVRLKGADDGNTRILLARLAIEKKDGRIAAITAEQITPASAPARDSGEADFAAHTNPSGTWIEFGLAATDGAIKINLEKDRLVVFPYPRGLTFRAEVDLKALAPGAVPDRVRVRALAAGTQADLGPVEARVVNGRLLLNMSVPAAGRYLVTWP
jgi:hypothetical protein